MINHKYLELKSILNEYGRKREPFFFMVSYDLKDFFVQKLENLDDDIKFDMNNTINSKVLRINLTKEAINFNIYKNHFELLQKEIRNGNSYLLNFTVSTKVNLDMSLEEVYHHSSAKFKLKFKDKFVCFSPERFVEIIDNKIYTYPVKGTISTKIKDCRDRLLNDKKEIAEHTMVVDLLRNDLSMVSRNVSVDKFRYIEQVNTGEDALLQTSSKISGCLDKDWQDKIGDILLPLLPAGSITGTPKIKTIEILNKVESHNREFYTGIFGVYDGVKLDSSVMIRFIQKNPNGNSGDFIYKSGGGITCESIAENEYKEVLDKIYIPI